MSPRAFIFNYYEENIIYCLFHVRKQHLQLDSTSGLLQNLTHEAHLALEIKKQSEILPKEMKEFAQVGFLSTAPQPSAR